MWLAEAPYQHTGSAGGRKLPGGPHHKLVCQARRKASIELPSLFLKLISETGTGTDEWREDPFRAIGHLFRVSSAGPLRVPGTPYQTLEQSIGDPGT